MEKFAAALGTLVLCFTFASVNVSAQKKDQPLSKVELVDLLKSGVPAARVRELVLEYGVSFDVTPQSERQLRKLGASRELLKALRTAAPKRSPVPDSSPSPAALQVHSTPGSAEVYVDDELKGRTSPEGRLVIPGLRPGPHKLRVSSAGYRDDERTVELVAGQASAVTSTLQASKPQAPVPDAPEAPKAAQSPWRYYVKHLHVRTFCEGPLTFEDGVFHYRSVQGVPRHSFDFTSGQVRDVTEVMSRDWNSHVLRIRRVDGESYDLSPDRQDLQTLRNAVGTALGRERKTSEP